MGFFEDSLIMIFSQVGKCDWYLVKDSPNLSAYFSYLPMSPIPPKNQFFWLQGVFFIVGWVFFVIQLFRDYEVRHRSVQLIFSVTFALSCTMFELIIFEIIGVLDSRCVFSVYTGCSPGRIVQGLQFDCR